MRTPVVCVAALALVGSACSDTNGEGSDPTDSSTTAATPTARSDDTVDSVIEVDVTSEAPPDPAVAALRDARLANDGEVPLGLALELFASAYGDLAGVDPRFEGSTAIHNSLAIRRVGAHWSELDDELRSAIEDYLTEPVAPGFRAPSTAGVDPATVNGIVAEFERHLRPLNAEIEVIPSNAAAFRRGERLADAAPIRGGRPVFAGQFDTCQVRFPAGTPPTTMTLAHEIMHCFQFEMAPLDVVFDAPDWYVEGSAEWAGATVGGSDSTLLDHYDAWQTTTESLTALDYEAVGFFWTVETMGADPWDEVPFVLSSELRGPAAFPVLMSQSELVRRMTTGSLRAEVFQIAVDKIWDLSPPAVPATSAVIGPHQVRRGTPVAGGIDGGPYSRLMIQEFEVHSHGVDVRTEGTVGALQPVGGDLRTIEGDSHIQLCFDDDGPHELYLALARTEAGPLRFAVRALEDDEECGTPVGQWVLDQIVVGDGVSEQRTPVLEISGGPAPALFSGRQIATAEVGGTDCPLWGDLELVERIGLDDRRLLPPDDHDVEAAWEGTMTFWCIDNPDDPRDVVVGVLDDGRLVLTFSPVASWVLGATVAQPVPVPRPCAELEGGNLIFNVWQDNRIVVPLPAGSTIDLSLGKCGGSWSSGALGGWVGTYRDPLFERTCDNWPGDDCSVGSLAGSGRHGSYRLTWLDIRCLTDDMEHLFSRRVNIEGWVGFDVDPELTLTAYIHGAVRQDLDVCVGGLDGAADSLVEAARSALTTMLGGATVTAQ